MSHPMKLLGLGLLAVALPAIVAGQTKRKDADDNEREARKHAVLDLKRISPAEQRILAALDGETETGFIDTALKDAIDFLEEQHGIAIIIDEAGLVEEGLASDEPINLDIQGITLRSALNIMLEPLSLTYVIEDEVMKITTRVKAEKALETRVYDVSLLARDGIDSKALAEVVEQIIIETTELKQVQAPAAPQQVPSYDAAGGGFDRRHELRQKTKPVAKTSAGGSVAALPGCLVVRHNQRIHGEVVDLLQQLHRLRSVGNDQ